MIEREKVLANNLLIGDKDSPTYSYKNRNMRSGSLKGSFSLDPIVNELAVDTFQFTVHYDPDAQMIAYSPVDMGNGVYRCFPDGSGIGTLENSGWYSTEGSTFITVTGNTVEFLRDDDHIYQYMVISPSNSTGFSRGDILTLPVNVESVSDKLQIWADNSLLPGGSSLVKITSAFGLFDTQAEYSATANSTGRDVLTIDFSGLRGTSKSQVRINTLTSTFPQTAESATLNIPGMKLNSTTVYGSAVGKIYLCRPTNPIPLDKYLTDVPYGTPVWWMCEES